MPTLEEAPFEEYLRILRKEGYEDDAELADVLYVETLTAFGYTKEQIYDTPFKNLVQAMQTIMDDATREFAQVQMPLSVSGQVMRGKGANNLSDQALDRLTRRQLQLTESEKLRLSFAK
jgi:methylmalonyl-CoA mutase N-terminal domain/subunit